MSDELQILAGIALIVFALVSPVVAFMIFH
jgi:hypothetical protein